MNIIPAISGMSPSAISRVQAFEAEELKRPQLPVLTSHVIHAGVYYRTVMIQKGTNMTGALIKIPTTLTLCGDAWVDVGADEPVRIRGYHVMPAAAGRKQAFRAVDDTYLTMSFRTDAKTVAQAEEEFTSEAYRLASRRNVNIVEITGDIT